MIVLLQKELNGQRVQVWEHNLLLQERREIPLFAAVCSLVFAGKGKSPQCSGDFGQAKRLEQPLQLPLVAEELDRNQAVCLEKGDSGFQPLRPRAPVQLRL